MADIRCPMCGKPNPADMDTCQYCQARLKPLLAGTPSEPQSHPVQPSGKPEFGASAGKPEASAASSAGDWLSDFRTDESAESARSSPEESEAFSSSSDFGDWFSRLEEPAAAGPAKPAGKPEVGASPG